MPLDYKRLGFKCGIEIHQELSTSKLFCDCSTGLKEEKEIVDVLRKLRAVAGESEETDRAALYEMLRDRVFCYKGYEDEVCLVDTDSEPPHPVNPDALETALGVAKLFKLKVPDTICVMRKTVTDGSAISGFQRTMLVGTVSKDSCIETTFGKVKIMQLNLEEDACKIISKSEISVNYSLSRLGIPLLEIGTDASISNPDQAKEVALKIGTLLRSFKFVKRGLGTIRQDVNISIRQGARIEIKGWQELKTIPLLIDNEIIRQSNLIKIKQQLKTRGLNKFKKERKEVTKYFEKANSKVVQENLKNGGKAIALKLPKFAGVLKSEICPSKTLGRELSEYAKAYGTKGMIHTDEDLKKYGLENEFEEIKKLMDCRGQDLVIVAVEKEEIASKALDAVYERANLLLEGIPEETRIPNHETATSSYARPLPGANRLYPETDIPNIPVSKGYLKGIVLPEPLDEKTKRYAKTYSIPEELAREVIDKTQDFESLVKRYHVQPSVIAEILINHPKEIKKRYGLDIFVTDHLDNILTKLDLGEITKDGVFEILVEMAQGKKVDYAKYRPMSDDDIIRVVKEIKKNNKDMPLNALIGQVMEKIRGKAEGKRIVEIIKKT